MSASRAGVTAPGQRPPRAGPASRQRPCRRRRRSRNRSRSRGRRSRLPGSRTPGPPWWSATAASRGCRRRPGRGCSPARDAGRLLQKADDHVRSRPDRVEDIAGVDDKVHVPLQDGVDGPSVSLLHVDLALVAASLGIELRVPGVSQVRVRDVGYAYYVPVILPGLDPLLAAPIGGIRILIVDHTKSLAYQRHIRARFLAYVR